MVTEVTVSEVTWDGFTLSWRADDGAFEGFLVEVTDAESGAEWHNHTVAGDDRSLAVTGLSPVTWYRANIYGVWRGALMEPVHADTITGTSGDGGTRRGLRLVLCDPDRSSAQHLSLRLDLSSTSQLSLSLSTWSLNTFSSYSFCSFSLRSYYY